MTSTWPLPSPQSGGGGGGTFLFSCWISACVTACLICSCTGNEKRILGINRQKYWSKILRWNSASGWRCHRTSGETLAQRVSSHQSTYLLPPLVSLWSGNTATLSTQAVLQCSTPIIQYIYHLYIYLLIIYLYLSLYSSIIYISM